MPCNAWQRGWAFGAPGRCLSGFCLAASLLHSRRLTCHIELMATPLAYLNGAWLPQQELAIPIDDLGFLLGATVVERLRTFAGQVFRTSDHLDRLRRSLTIVGWDVEPLCQEVAKAIKDFVRHNGPQIVAGDDWNIACFITPGNARAATQPTLCLHGRPLPFHDWVDHYQQGAQATVVTTRQVPKNCWPAELKCRSRMQYYLADREAEAVSPGARAILLDQDGFVGEGSTANVVAYFSQRGLVTPRRTKVLPGVSQQVLFELAESLGIAHSEDDLPPGELASAEEIFFTSTSCCLVPVTQLDGRAVGTGEPGKMFQQLLEAWSTLVKVDIARQARRFSQRV